MKIGYFNVTAIAFRPYPADNVVKTFPLSGFFSSLGSDKKIFFDYQGKW